MIPSAIMTYLTSHFVLPHEKTLYGSLSCTNTRPANSHSFTVSLTISAIIAIRERSSTWEKLNCYPLCMKHDTSLAILHISCRKYETPQCVTELQFTWNTHCLKLKPFKPYSALLVTSYCVCTAQKKVPVRSLASAERVRQGEVGGVTPKVTFTWWLLGLALKAPWLGPGGPIFWVQVSRSHKLISRVVHFAVWITAKLCHSNSASDVIHISRSKKCCLVLGTVTEFCLPWKRAACSWD